MVDGERHIPEAGGDGIPTDRITSIFDAWYERRDRGEAPDPEEVIREHPDLAEALRARFQMLGVLDDLYRLPDDLPEGTPQEIGDYRILREIGRGGMGVVYEAEQKSMQRRVALKVLSLAVTSTAHAVKRFQREARAGGKLHHTNVVPIYGMGQHAGHWYYAMELVEGSPLNTVLDDVRRTAQGRPIESPSDPTSYLGTDASEPGYFLRVAGMFAGVADALEHAHQEGVIHRDVKPSNLLLEADGTLKLVDFGLAYLSDTGLPSMTVTGDMIGTPVYMSPEQATAKKVRVDHRTDIYSLGATLYEVLTLTPPFDTRSLPELYDQILHHDPPAPTRKNTKIPRDLETIVQKAMEKDREKRYPSAAALARDLQRFALGEPIRARRIGPVARAWRKVKRHRVRSALVATTVVLAALGALLAGRAAEEGRQRRALEYDRLLSRAEEVMTAAQAFASSEEGARTLSPAEAAAELLTRAIGLVPWRPDAFWLRSVTQGRTHAERWSDIEAAGRLGLPRRTWHITRAHLLEAEGRREEAARERELAEREPPTPESAYFEGVILARTGHREEAIAKLDEALRGARSRRHLSFLVHRQRAAVHETLGDVAAAMHDLRSLQEIGYDPISVRVRLAALERRLGRDEVAAARFQDVLTSVREDDGPETWVELCLQCRNAGQDDWRAAATEEALRRHPEHALVARERIRLLNETGAHDEALALAREAMDRHPDVHPLQGELARVHLESGDLAEARRAFEHSLELSPSCYHCLIGYGRTLYRLGELDASVATWKKAIEIEPRHAVGYYNLALDLVASDRLDEAEEAYRQAIHADASYDDAVNNLGTLLYERRGKPEEALPLIERAVALRPEYAPYRVNHGNVLLALGRVDAAEGAFLKALELDGALAEARNNLGALHLNYRADPKQALPYFEAAAEAAPDDPLAAYNVGLALNKQDRYVEALPWLRKAVELNDACSEYHDQLARALYFGQRDVPAALAEVERAIALPNATVEAYVLRGILRADEQRDYEEALKDFRKAVDLDGRHAIAQRNVGFALMNLHRPKEAIAAFDKALALSEALPDAHRWRANCFRMMGDLEAALAAYDRGLEALPDHVVLLNYKGILLNDVMGRHAEALEVFEHVAALAPKDWRYVANQGYALLGLGRIEEAVGKFLEAETLRPDDPHLPYRRGEVLLAHGRYDDALAAYDRASAMAPEWGDPWFGRIHLLHETGAWAEGLDVTRRAHERWPEHPYLRYMLVAGLWATGDRDEARKRATLWSDGDPPEGHASLYHAYLCAVAGRAEAAREAMAHASSPSGETLYSLAAIHALLGDDDEAVACLERSLEAGYRRHPGSVHEPEFAESDDPRLAALLARFTE